MSIEMVRSALSACLELMGYEVGSDSHGLRSGLYLRGSGDLARALFEFKPTAADACQDMYQGNWGPEMPPRFAVMPDSERDAPDLEMLEQIGVTPVFYAEHGEYVEFPDIKDAVAARLAPVTRED